MQARRRAWTVKYVTVARDASGNVFRMIWSRGNVTNHSSPVDYGLYRYPTDEAHRRSDFTVVRQEREKL